jgi:NitT/TauT family transport system substrate-binding protein
MTEAKLKEKGDATKRFTNVVIGCWRYILDGHIDEGVDAIMKQEQRFHIDAFRNIIIEIGKI